MTKYFVATDSTGQAHVRSTESRSYTHAVIGGNHGNTSWAGSLALAEKCAAAAQSFQAGIIARRPDYPTWPIEIVPAIETTAVEYRAISKANKGSGR